MTESDRYRGRFAPSPTGQLHFGSLVAAVASFLDARTNQGEWLVRIEDIDPPRVVPGSADEILRSLEQMGFEWDGPVLYQSHRLDAYTAALEKLIQDGHCFACQCSRREVLQESRKTGAPGIYPGTCRDKHLPFGSTIATRFRVSEETIIFTDAIQGIQRCRIGQELGDFIVRRADGLFAYQLAVVVDDNYQQINHVVRGADLLTSTAWQIALMESLGFAHPAYSHMPLACDANGVKLSKQASACPVNPGAPSPALAAALDFLGQVVPTDLSEWPDRDIWEWAMKNWQKERVPRHTLIHLNGKIPC